MKKAAIVMIGVILIAGLSFAQEQMPVKVTGEDDLVKEKGKFAGTWVHPDADITQYTKIYPWNTVFQFRDTGKKAQSTGETIATSRTDGAFAINQESKEKFEQVFTKQFFTEIGRSKMFEMVNEVGPDTLILRAAVLDIISSVPPNVGGTTDVYLTSAGEATLVFELIDSETGVIQARVAERRLIQPPGQLNSGSGVPANSNTIWMDVERWARGAAQDLRKALEKAAKKAAK